MKYTIRPSILSLSGLMLATAFCIYRVNSQEVQPQTPAMQERLLTQEEVKARQQFVQARQKAKETNFRAKQNNGSKRRGLRAEQLPEEVRAQAETLARQYREGIYPKLKKHVAEHQGLLPDPAFVFPEFAIYMQDAEYKGTGQKFWGRGSWTMGVGTRADGTFIARDVYSGNSLDEPHDIWANHNKFANYPALGKGFAINGWDDGQVTFDSVQENFYGTGKDLFGQERPAAAIPGQAGIPPEFKQGLKTWFKKLDKDTADAKLSQKTQLEAGEVKDGVSPLPNQTKE